MKLKKNQKYDYKMFPKKSRSSKRKILASTPISLFTGYRNSLVYHYPLFFLQVPRMT